MSAPLPRRLDRASAERLRAMLGELQRAVLFDGLVAEEAAQNELVRRISEQGFRLIDDLAGVVR